VNKLNNVPKFVPTEELDQFFNVSLDLLCIANTDGYFLRLNPVWEKVLGYTREDLMAKRFLEFVHPDDLDRTRQAVSTLASHQKVISFENRYRSKDGTYRSLEWNAESAGHLIYAAARDVTERKRFLLALEERLRFERLLAGLSARFVNIPPDRVDSEIEQGLRQILEFFQVERCGLLQILPDKASWQVTHAAVAEDVRPVPLKVELSVSLFPYAYVKLIHKREVHLFSKLDDLPAEATVDRQTSIEWGIRSCLYIPIIFTGAVVHVIAIDSVMSEHVWPEEFIPKLQLLGEIFVNALERKQVRLEIQERLRFESLISDLSAGFVNLPPDQVGSEINKGLCSIVEFFDADRCSIGFVSEDGARLTSAYEHHSAQTEPGPEFLSKEQMPWYFEQLIRGNPVVMNRVEDLPPEAEKERQLCLSRGMKSVLSVPMASGGKTLGSFALVSTRAERVWPEELVKRFRLLSEVFGNALQRKQAEEASQEIERILRQNEYDLRRLAGRLISAQEEERSRLARELHDDLAQRLAVFAIEVGKLEQLLMDQPAPVEEKLVEMKKDIVKISQDVHSLSRQLHPSILDDLGLIKAVESECTNVSRREGIEIVFKHENIPRGIPKGVSLSLYRII
jgi:two-component system, NarL family, sensor kinase